MQWKHELYQNSKQRREIRKYIRYLTRNLKRRNHKLYLHNLKTIHNIYIKIEVIVIFLNRINEINMESS